MKKEEWQRIWNIDFATISKADRVPFDEPWIRGHKHSTIMALWMLIWTSFVSPFVSIASLFYFPLARKWLLYTGEYCWAWLISVSKWLLIINMALYIFLLVFTLIGILFIPWHIFWVISAVNGFNYARRSREIYAEEFLNR